MSLNIIKMPCESGKTTNVIQMIEKDTQRVLCVSPTVRLQQNLFSNLKLPNEVFYTITLISEKGLRGINVNSFDIVVFDEVCDICAVNKILQEVGGRLPVFIFTSDPIYKISNFKIAKHDAKQDIRELLSEEFNICVDYITLNFLQALINSDNDKGKQKFFELLMNDKYKELGNLLCK